ncbi:hypothetical protein ETB97_006334 [Aspergillus alliaceus]|uniref:Solid-state culture expressed protein (Aos23) n=1 Tax=Petromyces alliaceus TaxID=209559 RepID=A0A8H6E9W5_PETAA|nr:hypothetical protein ETB97_006334 [Aspergillus burnettii]
MEPIDRAWHTAADSLKNDYQTSEQQWTQHGEEPISGVQGRGTATDPYDAGNRSEQPGAPQTQKNTALVPEALSSITPADSSSDFKSSSKTASGPAAMQPELNPIGETTGKYGSQTHRAPEQRDVRSSLERQGEWGSSLGQGPSMTTAGAGAAGVGAGNAYNRSTGGLGDATSAQSSALGHDSHPTGLRHTGALGTGAGTQPTGLRQPPAQKSGLDRDTGATGVGYNDFLQKSGLDKDTGASGVSGHRSGTDRDIGAAGLGGGFRDTTSAPKSGLDRSTEITGLGHASTPKSGLDKTAETPNLGHATSPRKSALEQDARETGLRQPASTHDSGLTRDTQLPDRTSQFGTEGRHASSGITGTGPEARDTSSGVAGSTSENRQPSSITDSTAQKSTDQRTSTAADGQSSAQKESKPSTSGEDGHEGFTPKTNQVSKEALRGPSVAEPREGWKHDEKVAKAEDDKSAGPAGGLPDVGAGASNKKQEPSEKHGTDSSHSGGTMAHIKEKVKEVIHPHKS